MVAKGICSVCSVCVLAYFRGCCLAGVSSSLYNAALNSGLGIHCAGGFSFLLSDLLGTATRRLSSIYAVGTLDLDARSILSIDSGKMYRMGHRSQTLCAPDHIGKAECKGIGIERCEKGQTSADKK